MVDSYEKIDAVLERVASIREATGKYFGLAVDFPGRVHKPMAKILAKKLEELLTNRRIFCPANGGQLSC